MDGGYKHCLEEAMRAREEEEKRGNLYAVVCCLVAIGCIPFVLAWKVVRILMIIPMAIVVTIAQFIIFFSIYRDNK